MAKVTIDGVEIEVADGTTILNAARQLGGASVPPAMCYYSSLKGSGGKCRVCLVKVAQGSGKDPRPIPKLVASCSTPVADGMVVQNLTSPEVLEARKGVVEFLLINHPLDCPICDQGGECQLQDMSVGYGPMKSRYTEEKHVVFHKSVGPLISMEEMSRCIHCTRCVRFGQEIGGIMELGPYETPMDRAVELARRIAIQQAAPKHGGDRPHMVVLIDYDDPLSDCRGASLADGTQLTAGQLRGPLDLLDLVAADPLLERFEHHGGHLFERLVELLLGLADGLDLILERFFRFALLAHRRSSFRASSTLDV